MKIGHANWGRKYSSPYISIIYNKTTYPGYPGYIQISFVIWNQHWWIIINKKKKLWKDYH